MNDHKYPIGTFDPQDKRWNISLSENITFISHYPDLLSTVISRLTNEQMDTPYRLGGWTVTQLVHHISDSHMNAYIRFKLSLTEDQPSIKPYEEGKWAKLPDSNLELVHATISIIKALHTKLAYLMIRMKESEWEKSYYHPADANYVTLYTALKMYHWHSAHHLAHITELVKRENW